MESQAVFQAKTQAKKCRSNCHLGRQRRVEPRAEPEPIRQFLRRRRWGRRPRDGLEGRAAKEQLGPHFKVRKAVCHIFCSFSFSWQSLERLQTKIREGTHSLGANSWFVWIAARDTLDRLFPENWTYLCTSRIRSVWRYCNLEPYVQPD